MNCGGFDELLSAYLDDELAFEDKLRLEEHLRHCNRCKQVLDDFSRIKTALSLLPEIEIPENLHNKVMAAVGYPKKTRSLQGFFKRWPRWRFARLAPVLAGSLVLFLVVTVTGIHWLFGTKGLSLSPRSSPDIGEFAQDSRGDGWVSAPSDMFNGYSGGELEGSPRVASTQMKSADSATEQPKLIRRASLDLEVSRGSAREVFENASNVVAVHFGYVEQSSIVEKADNKQFTSFNMIARVPSDDLDPVIEDLSKLGVVKRQDVSAEDITDQYVDLNARRKNKEVQEERLLKIMGEADTVGELLLAEAELSRVREDLEVMEARINYFDKSVSMASLSLSASEEGARVSTMSPFSQAWRVFVNAWQDVLFAAANVGPGLITLASLIFGAVLLFRRRTKAN